MKRRIKVKDLDARLNFEPKSSHPNLIMEKVSETFDQCLLTVLLAKNLNLHPR